MKRKDVIKSLILSKQKEIPFDIIKRDIELPINSGQIITVPGVRRCGKSSLMMLVINTLIEKGVPPDNILWLGFDDERIYGMQTDELDEVIIAYREIYPNIPIDSIYMFFDEIQLVNDWEYFVLRLYKSYCKNIYVSGSNAQMLSGELSSALRGWPLEFEEFPLSFSEYCRFRGIEVDTVTESGIAKLKNTFIEFNSGSAFPEIVLLEDKSFSDAKLQGYFNTMLFRDLIERYKLTNSDLVRYFMKRIMANLSKPTSINSIYNDIKSQGIKVSKDKLYDLINQTCSIFLFLKVTKYDKSLIKENSGLSKYYCIDNGLRNAVLLPQSGDDGKLLENTVFLHLRRNMKPQDKIFYFHGNNECDFVYQRGEKIEKLIQVTWDMSDKDTKNREIDGLYEAAKATGCKALYIITFDMEAEIVHAEYNITIIPVWKWLLNSYSL